MTMKRLLKILLVAIACQFSPAALADERGTDANVLERMFVWWNGAYKEPDGFTGRAFRRYYTEDAAIFINGDERARGIEPMVEHFRRIQKNTESVEIVLPFEEGFASGDRIFTHHLIRARAEGADRLSQVMGYAVVEGGKISLINFLSHQQEGEK